MWKKPSKILKKQPFLRQNPYFINIFGISPFSHLGAKNPHSSFT